MINITNRGEKTIIVQTCLEGYKETDTTRFIKIEVGLNEDFKIPPGGELRIMEMPT